MSTNQTPSKPDANPDILKSNNFSIKVYQDFGKDTPKLPLPNLSALAFAYEFSEEEADPLDDMFKPFSISFQAADDEDEGDGDVDMDDEDDDDDEDMDEEGYTVTLRYHITRDLLTEFHGAFPIPDDSFLVFEITHLDANGKPVFVHLFSGAPSHPPFIAASKKLDSQMVGTLVLHCEQITLYDLWYEGWRAPEPANG